jgi:hypothetical protein
MSTPPPTEAVIGRLERIQLPKHIASSGVSSPFAPSSPPKAPSSPQKAPLQPPLIVGAANRLSTGLSDGSSRDSSRANEPAPSVVTPQQPVFARPRLQSSGCTPILHPSATLVSRFSFIGAPSPVVGRSMALSARSHRDGSNGASNQAQVSAGRDRSNTCAACGSNTIGALLSSKPRAFTLGVDAKVLGVTGVADGDDSDGSSGSEGLAPTGNVNSSRSSSVGFHARQRLSSICESACGIEAATDGGSTVQTLSLPEGAINHGHTHLSDAAAATVVTGNELRPSVIGSVGATRPQGGLAGSDSLVALSDAPAPGGVMSQTVSHDASDITSGDGKVVGPRGAVHATGSLLLNRMSANTRLKNLAFVTVITLGSVSCASVKCVML